MLKSFLSEISSPLLIRQEGIKEVRLLADKMIAGEQIPKPEPLKCAAGNLLMPGAQYQGNPYDQLDENSVAVIPIIGTMYKYGYWYGMDDVANMLRMVDASQKTVGSVLLINTPGGTTHSIIQLEDALRNRTKPCVAFVDAQCCSAGIYTASLCDKIIAANRMCEIGSIGTFVTLVNDEEYYQKHGIKFITVYPPESQYKNKEYRDAIDGDPQSLIEQSLTPYAQHFQDIIKTNRPNLDLTVEGIIEGKVFYAYDALTYGLIDGINNLTGAVQQVHNLHNEQKSIYSPFKQ